MIRPAGALVTLAWLACCGTAFAAPVDIPGDLYTGHAIVTGTDARERPTGFARALREVLVKLTGEPALADDPRIAADADAAESLAEDFVYQDRMSDVRTHDEQGTRDRPYDLTVHFAPARVDSILARIGVAAWSGPRPPLVLVISMTRGADSFPLTADGLPDERPREAAEAAGTRFGMRIVLPTEESVAAGRWPELPGAVPLRGALMWSAKDFGWVGTWRMEWQGRKASWSITGVSFDEAFRNAVSGAARIMSRRGS